MNDRDPWGYFTGPVQVKWISDDPRLMIVINMDVVYVDRCGFRWIADIGRVINGASVPWFFRRVFPAYVGLYRRATVIHDVACRRQDRSSKDVHRMFYEAMRCDGVGAVQAWIMWAAVRVFGPRFAATEKGGDQ